MRCLRWITSTGGNIKGVSMWPFTSKSDRPRPPDVLLRGGIEQVKALKLLWLYLTPKQRAEYIETRSITIKGYSGAVYTVEDFGSVYLEPGIRFCVRPIHLLPAADIILHWVLALQTERGEREFLGAAVASYRNYSGYIVDPIRRYFTKYPAEGAATYSFDDNRLVGIWRNNELQVG